MLVLVGAAASYMSESRTESIFNQAVLGQTEASIEDSLGKPDQVLPCGKFLRWNGDMANPPLNDGRCVKWARYNYALSAYAFGYSKDGKLVSRYHYVSE